MMGTEKMYTEGGVLVKVERAGVEQGNEIDVEMGYGSTRSGDGRR